jgi:predicted porin
VLALAAIPAVSMADVTIYGRIAGGVENDSITTQPGAGNTPDGSTHVNQNNVEDYLSWIGFKGQEDVGNGLKAIWNIENYIVIEGSGTSAHGQGTFASRDTFVGLAGGFGTVRLGKIPNAQRDMYDVDVWNNSNGANALDIFKRVDYRPNNAIRYDSPDFSGFSASALWGAGENKNTSNGNGSSDVYNVGLNYRHASGFFAQYGYDYRSNASGVAAGNGHAATNHRLEAGYIANNWHIGLGYSQSKGYNWDDRAYFNESTGFATGTATNVKTRELALTVAYSIGPWTPTVSLAHGWNKKDDSGTISDSGYNQYIVGVDYHLSKRTKLTLDYGHLNFGDNANYSVASGNTPLFNNIFNVKRQATTSLNMEHWF